MSGTSHFGPGPDGTRTTIPISRCRSKFVPLILQHSFQLVFHKTTIPDFMFTLIEDEMYQNRNVILTYLRVCLVYDDQLYCFWLHKTCLSPYRVFWVHFLDFRLGVHVEQTGNMTLAYYEKIWCSFFGVKYLILTRWMLCWIKTEILFMEKLWV